MSQKGDTTMAGELPRGFVTDVAFDPAEDYIGPFYYKQDGDSFRYAFRADDSGVVKRFRDS